jgi:ubiquinone/menaquinone biosynthesis C-methylase UbiE
MSLRSTLFALTHDAQMARVERFGMSDLRERLLAQASGRVLEIGARTGTSLVHYGVAVDALTVVEPDPTMLRRLERRAGAQPSKITVLRAPAEDLPFEDGTFDVAVSTLVLCGVSDQPRALRELHRVLRPGGELLFIEHVRSGEQGLARLQDRVNGMTRLLVGCECNRPTLETIQAAGFDVVRVEHALAAKVPPFVRPLVSGSARPIPGRRYPESRSSTRRTIVP